MEKYCWCKYDIVCGDRKQLGHISKVCKSKNKASKQAQLAKTANAQEEQLFSFSYFSTNDSSGTWLVDSGCTHYL